jgi:chromosomal replication initiation ATPase DnaA
MKALTPTFNIFRNVHIPRMPKKDHTSPQIIEIIKDSIAIELGLEFEDYDWKSRKRNLTFARYCFWKLCRRYTHLSLYQIGLLFKQQFNHTTVISGCVQINNLEDIKFKDPRYKEWLKVNERFNRLRNLK